MPWAKDNLEIRSGTSTEQVFNCAEVTLQKFNKDWDAWRTDNIKKDIREGVFESGDFSEPNQVDFRLRLHHLAEDNVVEIELKGSWAYYGDLGVDEGIIRFKSALQSCLEHSNKNISGNFFKRKIKIHD